MIGLTNWTIKWETHCFGNMYFPGCDSDSSGNNTRSRDGHIKCHARDLEMADDFSLNFPVCWWHTQLIHTYLNSVLVFECIWVQSGQMWEQERRNYGIVEWKKQLEVYWGVSCLTKNMKMKGEWNAYCFSNAQHGVGETVPNRPGFKCWLCYLSFLNLGFLICKIENNTFLKALMESLYEKKKICVKPRSLADYIGVFSVCFQLFSHN